MFTTFINDCRDANAVARQISRANTLLEGPADFCGVSTDLEAAGNLVDVLDAANGQPGNVLINVAPRHDKAKRWPNGTPLTWLATRA